MALLLLRTLKEVLFCFPVLRALGEKRIKFLYNTFWWVFALRPTLVSLVVLKPSIFYRRSYSVKEYFMPSSFSDANCAAYVHDVLESGDVPPGYYGMRQEKCRLQRWSYQKIYGKKGFRLTLNRIRLGNYLDGMRRVNLWSLLSKKLSEERFLVQVLWDPNIKFYHVRRLDSDGTWSEKFKGYQPTSFQGRKEKFPSLTIGYYWLYYLDSAPRAHFEKEPRTRVKVLRELGPEYRDLTTKI